MAGRFYYQPGSGVQFTVGPPPTERLKPLDDYAQKVRARAPARHGLPVRAARDGRRAGRHASIEHDLDDAGRAGAGRPAARAATRPAIVVGVVTTPTDAAPRGHHPGACCCGDPTRALGAVSEAGVRRGSSPRSTSPSELQRAGRVVRAVGRRPDRDGLRHREHGLGRPGAASGSSSSPRPAARSTSWSPASTSAPSRTGTPKRRCSCTPRASWS